MRDMHLATATVRVATSNSMRAVASVTASDTESTSSPSAGMSTPQLTLQAKEICEGLDRGKVFLGATLNIGIALRYYGDFLDLNVPTLFPREVPTV